MNQIERNIIIGSLLGDGSLALYGRSINAHYREHGCDEQMEYRRWKAKRLERLDFKFSDKGKYGKVSSPSTEMFTKLYNIFYKNRVKILTKESVKLLDHPIGLACLYMDDGTLVMDTSRKKKIYVFPRITIYTLNFTKEENEILKEHISNTFGINFILKKFPTGHNYALQLNKISEILKFIEIVSPFVNEIDCMKYKINIKDRLDEKAKELELLNPTKEISKSSLNPVSTFYSIDDENLIIKMKVAGYKDKEIAKKINRSYSGITHKIMTLRKANRL